SIAEGSTGASSSLGTGDATYELYARTRGAAILHRVVAQADRQATGISVDGLAVLARALAAAAGRPTLAEALDDVANAARVVVRADLVLVRVAVGARLEAVAVAGPPALAAELEGTHLPAADVPQTTLTS